MPASDVGWVRAEAAMWRSWLSSRRRNVRICNALTAISAPRTSTESAEATPRSFWPWKATL